MKIAIYVGVFIFAILCSLFFIFKESKTDLPPGNIVLRAFFQNFGILGMASLWWLFAEENEVVQSLGVIVYGVGLAIITLFTIKVTFMIRH